MGNELAVSVLDFVGMRVGESAGGAIARSVDLAQHVEQLGYKRYWLAEHHSISGLACSATPVLIWHVAAATKTIRVGSGGIMLPNHAPLIVAEQFGTLAALYPGRIDLGLGRAPGTDQFTMHALRRNLHAAGDDFPQDVLELMGYFRPAEPGQRIQAVPGAGLEGPTCILGSSLFGAQLAGALGLPYAFASHFAPAELHGAMEIYRSRFKPSEQLGKPYVMLGINVIAAESDRAAERLFTSLQQAFVNLRAGRPGPLPPPVDDMEGRLDQAGRAVLSQALSCSVVGSVKTVKQGLADFIARTGADELMVTAQIFDHRARLQSFQITAEAHG